MNKNALKKFATSSRVALIGEVEAKVNFLISLDLDNLPIEYRSHKTHLQTIRDKTATRQSKEDFIEEVAYMWFNRLIALRFMDINCFNEAKVLTPLIEDGDPEILQNAKNGTIDESLVIDKEKFYALIDRRINAENPHNEAYKMLFVSVCNQYFKIMPFMFEAIADFTELLLPNDLLSQNSIRAKTIEAIDEDSQNVEIIGWLYQFYISEKKDDVFEKLKKNVKITPSNIPAATQLFTPHWIVKYMVENSLGKLWMLNHPSSSLKESMKYYIEEEIPTDTFLKISTPEELTLLDPCCGSGHILTYAFDLLTLIYEEQGYSKSEIPTLILENNIYGCDIDKRAATLANFALTMKARLYHRRFFKKSTTPNVIELVEYGNSYKGIKNFGSLLTPKEDDLNIQEDGLLGQVSKEFKLQTGILSSQYSCVITNPPYMGGKGMNKELTDFVKDRYPDSKSDLFSVFMERTLEMTQDNGFMTMINQPSWLFLSSFEKLRIKLLEQFKIDSLLHMGRGIFGIDWGSTAFVINKAQSLDSVGSYFRLHKRNFQHIYYYDIEKIYLNALKNKDYKFDFDSYRDEEDGIKEISSISNDNGLQIYYTSKQSDFEKIPGSPIAYWVSKKIRNVFNTHSKLGELSDIKQGMSSANNDYFLRQWFEICFDKKDSKWYSYNKGGDFRKWYGNLEYLINWDNDGYEVKNFEKSVIRNEKFFFRTGITWSAISSDKLGVRFQNNKNILGGGSNTVFFDNELLFVLGMLSTKVVDKLLNIINPTLNFSGGVLEKLPIIFPQQESTKQQIDTLTQECIDISKEEWDSRETSWDFTKNELLKHKSDSKIETAYNNYCSYWKEQFYKLHTNEEELNRLFIDIYELQDELTPDVDLKDITILKQESFINDNKELEFNSDEIMKQFISYGVGVMFGRYSLDSDGLVVANLNQDYPKDTTYEIDDDNVIPVLEDDYFSDDIASRVVSFVKTTFGSESLSENINFIEKCLGKTIRAYMVKDFYEDHIKRYKKRPIYWMVSSPKKGFMSLSYMHRYTNDLFARVQNNYLREYITKLESALLTQEHIANDSTNSPTQRAKASKEIDRINKKIDELIKFDRESITKFAQNRIELDLDDGVKANYLKFMEILYPIKGME